MRRVTPFKRLVRWTKAQRDRYGAALAGVRERMRCADRDALPRITIVDVHRALVSAGYRRSYTYVASVLSGEKSSRACLSECSAAVRAIRQRREGEVPDWL